MSQDAKGQRRVLSNKLKLIKYAPRYVKSGKRNLTDIYAQVAERRGMVVRRGEVFFLDLEFEDQVDDKDLFSFHVITSNFGAQSLHREWHLKEKPTRILDDESYLCPIQVRHVLVYKGSNTATVVFHTAPDCIVAKYWITKLCIGRSMEIKFGYDIKFPVSVIFNPFNPRDAVYMANADERNEYVMADEGCLYSGTSRNIRSKPWYFAQFEDPVLDCAYLLLAKADLPLELWANPVEVARALSALVNSNNDAGVLVGNWSGNYTGGVAPTEWKSSLPIVAKYFANQEPVRFGQCWAFSGLLTTFARALGIPARSVTTFDSAHDTNGNLVVDHIFKEVLIPINEESTDLIWNFHVWNDLWMKRADISDDLDLSGWQAVDATPQESSSGIYRTGPSPLKAIKEGMVNVNYDTSFVFAEVNACIRHWFTSAGSQIHELFSDPFRVGQFISTKAVGKAERHDITDEYKYREGSVEEEAAYNQALSTRLGEDVQEARRNDNVSHHEISIEIVTAEYLVIGNDLRISLVISNGHGSPRNIQYGFSVALKRYNGKLMKEIAEESGELKVEGMSANQVEMMVNASDYTSLCGSEEVGFEIFGVAVLGEDKVLKQTVVNLIMPELQISISGEVAQNKTFHFSCVFVNTMSFDLHDARFSIEGPGLRGENHVQLVGEVKKGGSAKCSITLTPVRCGPRHFIAAFDSTEIKGVVMEYPVYVVPDPSVVIEDVIIPVTAAMQG